MNITFVEGGEELLDRVAPLWGKLNEYHADIPTFFKDDMPKRTFDRRNEQWIEKAMQGLLRIDLALEKSSEKTIGYCVTVIHEGYGRYMWTTFRKTRVGSSLIELRWNGWIIKQLLRKGLILQ